MMEEAIKEVKTNARKEEGGPFGAVIVKDGKIIGRGHNTVLKEDATCHAEINAIRDASKKIGWNLEGCTIYSTVEPCPMCFSAIHWAKIERIVYGATIEDAKKAGFNELSIENKTMKKLGKSDVSIEKIDCPECIKLLEEYKGELY